MGRIGIGIISFCMIIIVLIPIGISADETNGEVVNHLPVPIISSPLNWTKYLENYDIYFDCSNSTDEDGDELSYLWHSDKDGYLGIDPIFRKKLWCDNHLITLRVSDGFHNVSVTAPITVVPGPIQDTDQDGVQDIIDKDDDDDGLLDIDEDINMNGLVDEDETDPKNPDTDGDGVNDKLDHAPLNPMISKSKIESDPPLICMIGGIIFLLFCSGILALIFFIEHGMWKKKNEMG